MSYDIWLIGTDALEIPNTTLNVTYNLANLFYDHMDGGLYSLDMKTTENALPILEKFWNNLEEERITLWKHHVVGEPALQLKYDAPNGWGSLIGGLIFVGKLQAMCAKHKNAYVHVA